MSRLKELIHEIHRRSLWQVLGIYLASSWVVFEVVQTLTEGVGLPGWVPSGALVALLIGLPIVMATAFVQEGLGGRGEPAPAETERLPTEDTGTADDSPAPGAGDRGRMRHSLFTWRNALLGGVGAFALLGVVAAGYMLMRTMGIGPAGTLVAKGVLEKRDRIVVADFENLTPDTLLADVVTEALRVDLAQSPVVRLAEPAFVSEALARMELPAHAKLTEQRALELAEREGIKAVLSGEIGSAGAGYVLSAQLRDPATGEVLTSGRETASDSTSLVSAIDRLSEDLRERIGESLRSLRADPPLAQVTTGSMAALRKYTQAVRTEVFDFDRQIPLLREAIRLDSTFAMAWRRLALIHAYRFETDRLIEASTRAYELRDHLTEPERHLAVATYHHSVTGKWREAAAAFQRALDVDPDHGAALHSSGFLQRQLRQFDRAEELARRAVASSDSMDAKHWQYLVEAQYQRGRLDEAEATLALARQRLPESTLLRWEAGMLAAARQRWAEAEDRFVALSERESTDPFWRGHSMASRAAVAAVRGRLSEARRLRHEAVETLWEDGLASSALWQALRTPLLEAIVARDPDSAHEQLQELLRRFPLEEIPAVNRPYPALAVATAWAGRPGRAREFLAAMDTEIDPVLRERYEYLRGQARATIALVEGRFVEAIREFQDSDKGHCVYCPLPGLAAAYEGAGATDSAVAVYARYLEVPHPRRVGTDQVHLGPTYERLGQLYDEQGDLENAARWYAKFVELWRDADPELQPRVEAAQQRLEEIVAERG